MGFAWSDELSVGVERIDGQHRELIGRVNGLLEALPAGEGPASQAALDTLAFLSDYVITHFADEEELMAEVAYPGAAAHRAEHEGFREALRRMVRRFSLGGVDEGLRRTVEREVCDWLVRHLMGTDKALGRFVLARAARAV